VAVIHLSNGNSNHPATLAQIRQLDAGLGDQDVVGLQVAVDHALDVRGVKRAGHLLGVLQEEGCALLGAFTKCQSGRDAGDRELDSTGLPVLARLGT